MTAQPQPSSQWLKTTFPCPEAALEAVTDLLGVLSGSAVEQSPVKDGLSQVSGFFAFTNETGREDALRRLEQELRELLAAYGLPAPQISCSVLADEDWATSWQQYFKPFAIVPGLIIKPSWESYAPQPGEQVLEMDPGMAFGTGQHASTKLALSLVEACCQAAPPQQMLDVGTGTGILAMAAALFGAKAAAAIDNDPVAVAVAAENIARNGLAERVTVSAEPLEQISGQFDLICANILHDVLVELAPALVQRLAAKGQLVLSGLLCGSQEESILRIYGQLGLRLRQAVYEEEWVSLLLEA
ncbi:50S ribosomal protein L11 methyltransferase [Candidatus Electronema sp. JC]|uniref:50S ribosomal protein L11 methyltransferase n=1 Tax=Candidatus Electronema sp. JC TaxID=3401570 RepID=UPI003B43A1C6